MIANTLVELRLDSEKAPWIGTSDHQDHREPVFILEFEQMFNKEQ